MRRWLSLLYHCHCLKAEARKPAPDKDRVAAEFAAIDDDLRMIPIVWEQWIKVVTGDPKSNAWSQGYAGAPFWFKEYAGDDAPIWRKSLESCLAVFKKRLDAFKAKFR